MPESAPGASARRRLRGDLTPPRRAVVGGAVGALAVMLTGCSSGSKSSSSSTGSSASNAGTAGASSSATSGSSTALPGKDDILARFGERTPKAWALNLPGEVVSVPDAGQAIALTFDACGGPGGSGYDEKLITLLRQHEAKATLNFNARWIEENPSIAKELAADPLFHIANHGTRHLPLSTTGRSAYGIKGTTSLSELYDEVVSTHDWIAEHCPGQPLFFRSGTAFSDDIGVDVCKALGMPFLGFSVNADAGATFTPDQVTSTLLTARPGAIVISHMNQPTHGTYAGYARALPQLLDRGFTFRHV